MSRTAQNDERYQLNDIRVLPVGNGFFLAYSSDTASGRLIPTEAVEALSRCADLATLQEHALRLCDSSAQGAPSPHPDQHKPRRWLLSRFSRANSAAARTTSPSPLPPDPQSNLSLLRVLAEPGFLISETELLRLCRESAARHAPPPRISTIGIITRDRPKMLGRCLESLIANLGIDSTARPAIIIVDGSTDPSVDRAGREIAAASAKSSQHDIRYCGRQEKERFADALSRRAAVDPDLVRFMLFGVDGIDNSTGANRNALLLLTAGEMFLSFDDDTVCKPFLPNGPDATGIELDDRGACLDIRFFADRQSCLSSAEPAHSSLLASHERILGKDIGSCVLGFSEPERSGVPRFPACFIADLAAGRGRIAVTLNGTIGDSGMVSPFWLSLGGKTLLRLSKSASEWANSLNSREIWRTVGVPTLTLNPWLMTTAFGCDNRALLPPFFPVLRNQDGLFGVLSRICQPELYFGHLPEMIRHDPEDHRAQRAGDFLKRASGFGMWNLILAALMSYSSPAPDGSDSERLSRPGRHLRTLAELRDGEFREAIRIQGWALQSQTVQRLESELKALQSPPQYIMSDYRRYVEKLQESILSEDYIVPKDLARECGREQALAAAKELVGRYGKLLEAWPAIVEAAKRLSDDQA